MNHTRWNTRRVALTVSTDTERRPGWHQLGSSAGRSLGSGTSFHQTHPQTHLAHLVHTRASRKKNNIKLASNWACLPYFTFIVMYLRVRQTYTEYRGWHCQWRPPRCSWWHRWVSPCVYLCWEPKCSHSERWTSRLSFCILEWSLLPAPSSPTCAHQTRNQSCGKEMHRLICG